MSDRAVSEQRRKKQAQMSRYDRRGQRNTSNIFSAFTQQEIQEFKEAFNMVDQNHDGFIDHDDLMDMMTSLGAPNANDDEVVKMLNDAPGPVNFTMFLTMFSERLQSTDPGKVLLNAFRMFDEQDTGFVSEERLRHLLTSFCNRWSQEMVDELYNSPQLVDNRGFNYIEFVRRLKGYVALDDDTEQQFQQKQLEQDGDGSQLSVHLPTRKLSGFKLQPVEVNSILSEETPSVAEYSQIRTMPAKNAAASVSIPVVSSNKLSEEHTSENKAFIVKSATTTNVISPVNAPPNPFASVTITPSVTKGPALVQVTKTASVMSRSSSSDKGSAAGPINIPISASVPVEIRTSLPVDSTANSGGGGGLSSVKEEVTITIGSPVNIGKAAASGPTKPRSSAGPFQSQQQQQQQEQQSPVASTQKSIAELRQSFFSSTTSPPPPAEANKTKSNLPPPSQLLSSTSSSMKSSSQSGNREQDQAKFVSSTTARSSPSEQPTKTFIPVPIVNNSKRLAQDVNQMMMGSSKTPPAHYIDDTVLPPIHLEAKFEKLTITDETIPSSVSGETFVAREEPVTPSKTPWRQQQQPVQTKPTPLPRAAPPGTTASDQQISQAAKQLEASPPFASMAPEKKRYGSGDKLQESPKNGSSQVMLMQENPFNRQMPAYGYRTVTTTTTTTVLTSEEQMTSSSTSSKSEEMLDASPKPSGERKLSVAKIVLSNPAISGNQSQSSTNLAMTGSALPIRASITERMPPMTRIRSIESSSRPNDAASRIMSSSMTSISNTARTKQGGSPSSNISASTILPTTSNK